jgi:hypothetical protein
MKRAILIGLATLAAGGLATVGCGSNNDSGGGGGAPGTGGSATGGTQTTGTGGQTGGTGGSSSTTATCGTTDGSYTENTTFATEGSTAPYLLNKWGTWGNATIPALAQTTTGPTGLDCSAGCAALTMDFSDGTKQYSAGSIVEYFGTATDSVLDLLNETITVKLAMTVTQATGATASVPISISLFGQDTFTSTTGVDNLWVNDLGSASSLDAASGWHTATYKVTDAAVPSWKATRTVCASGLHSIGITIQNNDAITADNGGVVTLYIQSFGVSP